MGNWRSRENKVWGCWTVEYSAGPPQRWVMGHISEIKGLPVLSLQCNIPSQERDPDDGRNALFITGKGRGTTTVQAHRPRKAGIRHCIGPVRSDSTYSIDIQGEGPGTGEPLSDCIGDIIHFG